MKAHWSDKLEPLMAIMAEPYIFYYAGALVIGLILRGIHYFYSISWLITASRILMAPFCIWVGLFVLFIPITMIAERDAGKEDK